MPCSLVDFSPDGGVDTLLQNIGKQLQYYILTQPRGTQLANIFTLTYTVIKNIYGVSHTFSA
jgi:hypothetical protein